MIFPPITADIDGVPCSVSYTIVTSDGNMPSPTDVAVAEALAGYYEGAVQQMVAAARQNVAIGGVRNQRYARQWPGLFAEFTTNYGLNYLRLTINPSVAYTNSKTSISIGGVFDIVVPFTGLPLPGMGAQGGDIWPTVYKPNGPMYCFDPAFSPNDPGPTSRFDAATKTYSAAASIETPDYDYTTTFTGLVTQGLLSLPSIYDPTHVGVQSWGVPSQYWCKNTGGSAILTQPLSGKQYWEVEILALPGGHVPSSYSMTDTENPLANLDSLNGAYIQRSETTRDRTGKMHYNYNITWPEALDQFFTPSIGVCPGYYLPEDLLPGDPTKPPSLYQDYTRVIGLDPFLDPHGPKNKLARSISTCPFKVTNGSGSLKPSKDWVRGQWERTIFPIVESDLLLCQDFADYSTRAQAYDPDSTNPPPQEKTFNIGDQAFRLFLYDSFYNDPQPDTDPPPDAGTTYGSGTYAPNGDVLFYCYGAALGHSFGYNGGSFTASSYGPPVSWMEGAAPGVWLDAYAWPNIIVGGFFARIEQIFDGTDPAYPGKNIIQRRTPGFYAYLQQTVSVNCQIADGPIGSCHATVGGATPPADYNVPAGLPGYLQNFYTQGGSTPVFIGRLDQLYQDLGNITLGTATWQATVWEPTDGTRLPLDGSVSFGVGVGPVGGFTGVDLGRLQVGDVVMIAADTNTGYIWFGKNGMWYAPGTADAPSAPIPGGAHDGPSYGTKWAAIMDGAPRSATPVTPAPTDTNPADQRPQYFPAVGYHVGPLEAKIHYGVGMKYPTPSSFTIYGQTQIG